jgi:hypothetical protein
MPSPNTTPEPTIFDEPLSPEAQAIYQMLLTAIEDYKNKSWEEFALKGETTIYTPMP